MSLEKWKSASIWTKIATVCVGLSALFGIILSLLLLEDFETSMLFDVVGESVFIIYILAYYAIDFVVMAGLFCVKRWARRLAIWWGILAFLNLGAMEPSVIFVSYILSMLAAILLLIARKDFAKDKKNKEVEE